MRKLYKVRIFNGTPWTNQNNAVYFPNLAEMFLWFSGKFESREWQLNVNYDTMTFKLPIRLEDMTGYNYGVIYDPEDLGKSRYFFISQSSETNAGVTTITTIPDVVQTLAYGNRLKDTLGFSTVTRQHPASRAEALDNLRYFTTNDDLLSSTSNAFNIKQWGVDFFSEGLYIIFTTTVDLSADAGTKDAPNMNTSQGQTYDKITSPQNLYVATEEQFGSMMGSLSNKPWISRNITQVSKVPAMFVDSNDLEDAGTPFSGLKKFVNGASSANVPGILNIPISEIRQALGLNTDRTDDYMLRFPYTYLEITNNQGQSFDLKFEDLDMGGDYINIDSKTMFGYDNQISIYPRLYLSEGENTLSGFLRGDGLGLSITWKTWDSVATLIDNYKLTEASSAYTRNLAQDRTLGGRIKDITSRDASLMDRFSDAMDIGGVASGLLSKGTTPLGKALGLGKRINDDHMKMQDINAQLENSKISSPTLGNQNYANTFTTANNIFGLQVKLKRINQKQFDNVKLYHKLFGFDYHSYTRLNDFNMSVVNYIKSAGDHLAPNSDILPQWLPLLATRLDAGIKLWKPTDVGTAVFNQDVHNNFVL